MDIGDPAVKRFLTELFTATQGDVAAQISMYDLGAAIGLDRGAAGAMAEDIIMQGWAELKSLSGGIGITTEGIEIIQGESSQQGRGTNGMRLGSAPVLDEQGRNAAEVIVAGIRRTSFNNLTIGQLEEIVIDLKTIETQLLSPNPKTGIIRETLKSLQNELKRLGAGGPAKDIESLLSS